VVHRNRTENTVLVSVEKVKFRHLGEPGKAYFKYNLNNGRYVPFYSGKEPQWDNTNHLVEDIKKRQQEAADTAMLEFTEEDLHEGTAPCPF
jgi:twinkle protein